MFSTESALVSSTAPIEGDKLIRFSLECQGDDVGCDDTRFRSRRSATVAPTATMGLMKRTAQLAGVYAFVDAK
ncbi:hypothetical protein EVAR_100460_1 [Eumeta japonica]|uniref:Uncharacterized protein n=1 Tax=Eumeta variegata TaxID=151549 RepID=A0A4C1T727_EUMVA|nr:hypothetical protein EVAR_100460_1 [Eumeta japonica]